MIVVQGSIGPFEKQNLVIDTGAYPSVIDRTVASRLNLAGHREELDAIDRTVSSSAVFLPSFQVGPIQATGVRSLVADLSDVSRQIHVRVDGLVGLDVLARSSFRIDYARKKIYFGPVTPLPSSVPFHLTDSKFCVDVYTGARAVRLLVDTGAETTVLFGSRSPWIPPSAEARLFTNLGGSFVLHAVHLSGLQLGDTELTEPIFISSKDTPAYPFDGFLPTIQFQQVAFDFERNEFSWVARRQTRDRIQVATRSSSIPSQATSFAGETTANKNPAER